MSILGATLLSDRKLYSMLMGVKTLVEAQNVAEVYVNIQTSDESQYEPLFAYLKEHCAKPYHIDIWDYNYAHGFRTAPQYDQDTARLAPICTARNMALDVALRPHFSHLLFVDSDVVPHNLDEALIRFLRINKPIVGGVVPGRGAHRLAQYIFGIRQRVNDTLLRCDHGTCGYVLIQRSIYEIVRFRYGPHPRVRSVPLSEDPAYLADAEYMGFTDGWYIDAQSHADHIDNDEAPLTLENAYNGYTSTSDTLP